MILVVVDTRESTHGQHDLDAPGLVVHRPTPMARQVRFEEQLGQRDGEQERERERERERESKAQQAGSENRGRQRHVRRR